LGVGGPHGQFVTIQRLYNFRRQERFQLLNIGVLAAKVAKYVPLPRTNSSFSPFI